jgi:TRAP-type C4-dicarboxylate transport system substrate-binding protein
MSMKTKIMSYTILTVAGALIFISAYCGSALAYSKEKPMLLRVGCINPANDIECRLIKRVAEIVEQKSEGRIKFQFSYSGSLFNIAQFIEAVSRGTGDIANGPVSFARKIPGLNIFSVYGTYKSQNWIEMDNAINPTLNKMFEAHGIHLLMSWDPGPALFCHKSMFLKTPGDWHGQKMRLAGRWQSALGKKWGGSPIFLPPAELYLALQRGVIDGFMLPWHIVTVFKLYEVAPYITNTDFSCNLSIMPMNLSKWNSLTEEDKGIFNEAVRTLKPWMDAEMIRIRDSYRKDIVSNGAKVYDLTQEEKALYLIDAFAQWPEVRKISGLFGNELADILTKFRDE